MTWLRKDTTETCSEFARLMAQGSSQIEVVRWLANRDRVGKQAIYKRLRNGGALPPYGTKITPNRKPGKALPIPGDEIAARRVFRDPCVRCGVRGDIGCKHTVLTTSPTRLIRLTDGR